MSLVTTSRLDELAAKANAEFRSAEEALDLVLGHVFAAGEALLEASELIPDGAAWRQWCEGNLDFTPQHAGRIMRITRYRDRIDPSETHHVGRDGRTRPVSVHYLYDTYVSGLPEIRQGRQQPLSEILHEEAKRLRAAGWSYERIAEELEVGVSSVYTILNPEARKRYLREAKKRRRELASARRALERERERAELDRLARARSKDPVGEAYASLRRLLAALDKIDGDTSLEVSYATRIEGRISRRLRGDL